MTTALAERQSTEIAAPAVTSDQLDLIRRTVANGATADELKLYLYDCARQGVHPLDRLVHFTKRGGKYTPITSIDFMRTRAADTGEYAGSDDALFTLVDARIEAPHTATVTVWRLVQGQRCSFTATARWSEYCPGQGQDHMWRKMPHTMLAKCAEALALRKGFPRQLAGLYAREEMDQAPEDRTPYVVEAPAPPLRERENAPAPSAGELGHPNSTSTTAEASDPFGEHFPPAPEGYVYLTKFEAPYAGSKSKGFLRHSGQASGEDKLAMFDEQLAGLALQCVQQKTPVKLHTVVSATTRKPYIKAIHKLETIAREPGSDDEVF